ncbi:MAG: isopentenyl-diphosphate Delta-isomerase [Actinomycetota bacterium]
MEQVVLLADDGSRIGTRAKADVHTEDTPLHLAFSCYVVRADGHVLVTRRALSKRTWPGVWTNSFCGHPSPDESLEEAVHRRSRQELGASLRDVSVALPGFRYRAVDASGIVENEICPVHIAVIDGDVTPEPSEVAEWAWVSPDDLVESLSRTPFAFSPWLLSQLPQLRAEGAL